MTTLLDAYNDILKRAGDGYANYIDRARELFWRALAIIIQSGEYHPHETSEITTIEPTDYTVNDFPLECYQYANENILMIEYSLSAVNIHTHEIPEQHLPEAKHRIAMSAAAGISELLWCKTPKQILIAYDDTDGSVTYRKITVEVKRISVPPETMTSAAETSNITGIIAITLASRAVEMATQLIMQELRG